jgi:hypothetical protein
MASVASDGSALLSVRLPGTWRLLSRIDVDRGYDAWPATSAVDDASGIVRHRSRGSFSKENAGATLCRTLTRQ